MKQKKMIGIEEKKVIVVTYYAGRSIIFRLQKERRNA